MHHLSYRKELFVLLNRQSDIVLNPIGEMGFISVSSLRIPFTVPCTAVSCFISYYMWTLFSVIQSRIVTLLYFGFRPIVLYGVFFGHLTTNGLIIGQLQGSTLSKLTCDSVLWSRQTSYSKSFSTMFQYLLLHTTGKTNNHHSNDPHHLHSDFHTVCGLCFILQTHPIGYNW